MPKPKPAAPVQFQIRLPAETHKALRAQAFQDDRSLAATARLLIDEGLKRRETRRIAREARP